MGNAREILTSVLLCEAADRSQYMRDYMRNRYHSVRDRVMKQLGGKCARCGAKNDLQFDHIDSSKKSLRMADIHSVSDARLQKELKNVQILCSKCHHEKSHEAWDFNTPEPKHGTYWMYRKHECRCPKCVKAYRKQQKGWRKNKKAARLDELKKLSGRWASVIRGEWWIDSSGQALFADQDIGEAGHEILAADYLLDKDALLEGLKERYPEEAERLENDYGGDEAGASAIFFNENVPDDIGAAAAGNMQKWHDIKKDVRLAFVKYDNAIMAINTDFWVWVLNDDAISRIQGFIIEEAEEISPQSTDEVTIEEASTKKNNSMPIGEFLGIKYPAQFWGIESRASADYLYHEMPAETLGDIANEGLLASEHDNRIYVSRKEPSTSSPGHVMLRFRDTGVPLERDADWYTSSSIDPGVIEVRINSDWVPLHQHLR